MYSKDISLKQIVYQTAEELKMTKSGHKSVYRKIGYWEATGMFANSWTFHGHKLITSVQQ